MAQGAYVGVSGKARRITGGFIGVSGKARRITKAYIGVGGKARPCWDSGARIAYYGSLTSLSVTPSKLAGATVGDYALFSGSSKGFAEFTNAYKSTLVRSLPSCPSALGDLFYYGVSHLQMLGASISNNAIFIATYATSRATPNNIVYSYNSSLTATVLEGLTTPRHDCAITNIGNNVLIAGGTIEEYYENDATPLSSVEVYTSSLTKGTTLELTVGRASLTSGKNINYVIFAGGYGSDVVDAFNSSLVRTTPDSLSRVDEYWEGNNVGDYALFIHGTKKQQNAYNINLVKTELTNDHEGFDCATATLSGFAIFAGGYNNSTSKVLQTVHTYDTNLVHSTARPLDSPTLKNVACVIGDYAIIAGGRTDIDGGYTANVSAYTHIS